MYGKWGRIGSFDTHEVYINNVSLREVPKTTEDQPLVLGMTYTFRTKYSDWLYSVEAILRYTTDGTAQQ